MKQIAAILCLFLLAGCGPRQSAEIAHPAPSSSLTMAQASTLTFFWTVGRSDRAVFSIAPTGSMAPVLGSNCLVLAEKFTGAVNVDDICVYDHDPALPAVCHRVVQVSSQYHAVIFEGDSNARSDGWIPMSRINWRVAGVLYCQRNP